MPKRQRKITIDVLVEGRGGELVFRPVQASKDDLRELLEATKNSVIKHNVFRQGTGKKVKI